MDPSSTTLGDLAQTYRERMSKTMQHSNLKSPESKSMIPPGHHEKREKSRLYGENLKGSDYLMESERRQMPMHLDRDRSSYHRPLFLDLHERSNRSAMYPDIMNRAKSPRVQVSPKQEPVPGHPSLLRTIDRPAATPYEKSYIDMDKCSRLPPRHHEIDRKPYLPGASHPFAPSLPPSSTNLLPAYNVGNSRYERTHR